MGTGAFSVIAEERGRLLSGIDLAEGAGSLPLLIRMRKGEG
jgi:hypothetical protein